MYVMATLPTRPTLRESIERTGYYPDVVQDVMDNALGREPVLDFIVQHETTFDRDRKSTRLNSSHRL